MSLSYTRILLLFIFTLLLFLKPPLIANDESRIQDLSQRNVYRWNTDQENWVIKRASVFTFMDTGRSVKTELFNDLGEKQHDEETLYSYDELGRIKHVETWTNEYGEDYRFMKRRHEISYLNDTRIIKKQLEYVKWDLNLDETLMRSTLRKFDDQDNITLFLHKGPNPLEDNDSIVYTYDEQGRLVSETQFNWNLVDCCTYGFTTYFRFTYSYDGDQLQAVEGEYWNKFPGEWVPVYLINNFTGSVISENNPDMLAPKSQVLLEVSVEEIKEAMNKIKPVSFLPEWPRKIIGQNCSVQKWDPENEYYHAFIEIRNEINSDGFAISIEEKGSAFDEFTAIHRQLQLIAKNQLNYNDPDAYMELEQLIEIGGIMLYSGNGVSEEEAVGFVNDAKALLKSMHIRYDDQTDSGFDLSEIKDVEVNIPESASVIEKQTTMLRNLSLTYQQYDALSDGYVNWLKQEFIYNGDRIYNLLEEKTTDGNLVVYPNPVRGNLQFALRNYSGAVKVELINATGQTVLREKLSLPASGFQFTRNVQHLQNGVYILRLSHKDGIISKKVLLE
ncbi:T9SS type A sorting domain-containing protein [Saccharicrinis sp. FJH54]|uniref:T9SS type A sorting domain-containing protein n=1 Tax=Saccharicrinis sp. FJH54 TaxID=3344665 RepID=UPI0035D4EA8C